MSGGRRVYGQGCVSALPRWALRLGRGAIRNCAAQVAHFAGLRVRGGLLDWRGTRPATMRGGESGRAQFGMFTQWVRGGWRGGFLLGAARRGVAF